MTELVEGAGTARSTLGGSSFPPIADYGFLSDYYAALCGRLERGMMVGLRREDKYSKATRAA